MAQEPGKDYNEAIAFQGNMNVNLRQANFHIETGSDDEEGQPARSFAADFVADQPDVPSNAKSVNRAVFMRAGPGASSSLNVNNSTINVVAGSIKTGGQTRHHKRVVQNAGQPQSHNYAALVRNRSGKGTSNVKVIGSTINISSGSGPGVNEAYGIDGAGNLELDGSTITISTGKK